MEEKEVTMTMTIGIYSDNNEFISSLQRALSFTISDERLYFYSFYDNDIGKVKNALKVRGNRLLHRTIGLFSVDVPPSDITRLVRNIRNELWDGVFIFIVGSEEQRKKLEDLDLFGESGHDYKNMRGHVALHVPFELTDLKDVVKSMENEMSINTYLECRNNSKYWKYWNKLCKIDNIRKETIKHYKNQKPKDASNVLIEWLFELNNINWEPYLKGHSPIPKIMKYLNDEGFINGETIRFNAALKKDKCNEFLDEINKIKDEII